MARMMFGGGIADWSFTSDASGIATLIGGAVITFWTQESGGSQLTDLTDLSGQPMTQVTTSNGSDGRGLGQIPPFFGPDGAFEIWASANGGPRALMVAANVGSYLGPMRTQLEAHVTAVNPHNTTLDSLTDVDVAGATTGQLLAKDADGQWKPLTVPGVGGTVQLSGDQVIAGTKTFENQSAPAAVRAVFNAAESQTADVLQVWSSAEAGQGGVRQKTVAANSKGELRLVPSKANTTAARIGAQSGQTAHVFQQVTATDVVLSWMEPNGSWRAPNIGRSIMFSKSGAVVSGAGTFVWTNDSGVPLTIRSVRASVNTAPTGASLIVDVNLNGVTVFSTQANRPTIAAGAKTSGKATGMSTVSVPDGGSLTVDVDQIGSTVAGSDLTVQVEVY